MEWIRSGPDLGRRSLDALRVGVLVLDAADRPVLANPSAHEMGLLRPGIAGASTVAHSLVRSLAGQVRRTGAPREVEVDLPRSAAEPLGLRLRAVALDGGHVTVEALDVTESHRLNRVRRDFVANVSHELKTPVGALRLLAEALAEVMEDGSDPAAALRFAERIRHESDRLGRLVTELLELSRLQGGEPIPAPEPVAVDRVVAEVVDRTRTAAAAKNIDVDWVGERGLVVHGSENQLVTALASLVENAITYSPEPSASGGGGRADVTIRTAIDGEQFVLDVIDGGIGIEAKDLDRIFERFYRADRARSRATGGTGLGLAIVKHIVTNHGGRIDVASTVGVGSTFTVRIPVRTGADDIATPASAGVGPDEAAELSPRGSR